MGVGSYTFPRIDPGSVGDVFKLPTPVAKQIPVWSDNQTLKGVDSLVFDANTNSMRIGIAPAPLNDDASLQLVRNTVAGTTDIVSRWTWAPDGNLWGLKLNQEHKIDTPNRIQYNFTMRDGLTFDLLMLSFSRGNVGVNEANPTARFHVGGGIRVVGVYTDSVNSVGSFKQILSSTVGGTAWVNESVAKVGTPLNNQVAVWTGDGTLEGDSALQVDAGTVTVANKLVVDVDTFIVDSVLDRVAIGDAATPLTDFTVFQSPGNFKGLTLSGDGFTSGSLTEGVSLLAGNVAVNNNQLWVVNKVDQGNLAKNSFRFIVGSDCPLIVGVNNTGTFNRNICLGIDGSGGNVGFGFPVNTVQADIQARIHVKEILDTIAVVIVETTATNPGKTKKFVGNRDPNANVTGEGSDEYYRNGAALSGSYESLEVTSGTVWNKRSLNPPSVSEILNAEQFDALASGGIVTISVNTTLSIKEPFVSANGIVVNPGITLHITATHFAAKSITFSGTGTFLTTAGGTIRIQGGPSLISSSTGTFLAFSGSGTLVINDLAIVGWDALGSFANGLWVHNNVNYVNCDNGYTVTDPFAMVFNVVTQFGSKMNGAFFTIAAKLVSGITLNSVVATNLAPNGATFDLDTRINNNITLSILNSGPASGDLFLKSTLADVSFSVVVDSSPSEGIITASVDNGAGGTKHSTTVTVWFEDEEVRITDKASFNGTFQIFNVVPGISFDTITPFDNLAVISVNSIAAGGSGYTVGDILTAVGGTFTTVATFQVTVVSAGSVTDAIPVAAGLYSAKPADPVATTGPGTGCTLNVNFSDETGLVNSNRIAITLGGGHGISAGNSLKLVKSSFYNDFYTALQVVVDTLTLNAIFIDTDKGDFEKNVSLDETNKRVKSINNSPVSDSVALAFGKMNDNSIATVISDGVYVPINCTSIVNKEVTHRFRLINATFGVYRYIDAPPFDGEIGSILQFTKTGAVRDYRLAFSINGLVPVFGDADHQPVQITTTTKSQTMKQVLKMQQNDTFQVMAAGDGTAENCTFTDVSLDALGGR